MKGWCRTKPGNLIGYRVQCIDCGRETPQLIASLSAAHMVRVGMDRQPCCISCGRPTRHEVVTVRLQNPEAEQDRLSRRRERNAAAQRRKRGSVVRRR